MSAANATLCTMARAARDSSAGERCREATLGGSTPLAGRGRGLAIAAHIGSGPPAVEAPGSTGSSGTVGLAAPIGGKLTPIEGVAMTERRSAVRTCPLCEATCGLQIELVGDDVVRIRGDRDDVFSRGYICPKGSTLRQLHEDGDRVRRPLVRRGGELVEVTWEEAFAEIADRLAPILDEHGRESLGIYIGNPNAHNLGSMVFLRNVVSAAGTKKRFSAGSVDQRPKEVSSGLMFGSVTVPVPDLDRTDLLVLMGANPLASNGSICTAPDFPGRLERLRERGGRLFVIDPVETATAAMADQHLAIRPATDAQLLASVAQVLVSEGLVDLGHVADHVNGLDDVLAGVAPFTPERVAPLCGVDAEEIRALARALASSPTAAVYGRIGTCVQEFGTTTSWLIDVINLITGNLDVEGGALFPTGAVGQPSTRGEPGRGRGMRIGRWGSRVSGLPEAMGELPVNALAEEIETEGPGQIRAMVCVGGNPVRSLPNSERLDVAFGSLDLLVAVDIYVNETTRHADVILPSPSALQKSHYDLLLYNFAVRNVANYSPPVLPLDDGALDEWEVLLGLARVLAGRDVDLETLDDDVDGMVEGMVRSAVADEYGPAHGRDPEELLGELADRRGPEKVLDHLLRTGPFGDGYGTDPDGLSLAKLLDHPHGVDLGPLQPNRLPALLRTPSGRIEAAPPELLADLPRLEATLTGPAADDGGLVLIGRRHLRSNNSWMHNVEVLVKGKERCTLWIHPSDAEDIGVGDGDVAAVRSRVGCVEAPVEVTDAIRPGVVSLPHGWGHDAPGSRLSVAANRPGVNANALTDDREADPVSGTTALSGVAVAVSAVTA
ncbi:MAG: molybdopterin-dependent oxidoreductase [Actinomycetota bacterium]